MAKLVYVTNTSLDGHIEDQYGVVDLYEPDDDVFAATTALLKSFGTFLYGRRLYETMAHWEANPVPRRAVRPDGRLRERLAGSDQGRLLHDPDRRVDGHHPPRTRLRPAAVQELKAAATSNLTIGGANLAARAFAAGLVDESQLFVWPMIVGGGKPALLAGFRTHLELLDEHRFNNGVVRLLYRIPS